MKHRLIAVVAILMILLLSIFGAAGAQVTADDPEVPTEEETTDGSTLYTHPVVKLLSAYFDRETAGAEDPADPQDGDVEDVDDTEGEVEEEDGDSGLGPIGEEIAAYHEEGIGFGVLVKVYAMVEESKLACESVTPGDDEVVEPVDGSVDEEPAEECVPLTADELISALKEGKGMGTLFKEYGKPAMLGVGHVKQELKKLETSDEDVTDLEDSADETDDKVNNGKGPQDKPNKPEKKDKPGKKP